MGATRGLSCSIPPQPWPVHRTSGAISKFVSINLKYDTVACNRKKGAPGGVIGLACGMPKLKFGPDELEGRHRLLFEIAKIVWN